MKAYKKRYDDSVVEFAFFHEFIIIFKYMFSFFLLKILQTNGRFSEILIVI
jgi:hypothetical protein